jgi:hypothetical protein
MFEYRARWIPGNSGYEATNGVIDIVLRVTSRPKSAGSSAESGVSRPGSGGSRIRIRESGFADSAGRDKALAWLQGRLATLNRVLTDAASLRQRTRQAIVVVHGIGEQLPTQTLRNFTEGIFPKTGMREPLVKPNYVSELFELRMMRIASDDNAGMPTTDIYELYWAHLIRDTTLGQVYGWLLRLLRARNTDIPGRLRKHFWAIRFLLLVITAGVVWILGSRIGQTAHHTGSHSVSPSGVIWVAALTTGLLSMLPTVGWAALRLLQHRFVVNILGDAARYLAPRPENIERRQAIRAAGLELIDRLHADGEYARIIMFGHSLGSVIAYDILCLAWIRRFRKHTNKAIMTSRKLIEVEDLLNIDSRSHTVPSADEIAARQYEAWMEYRRNGFEWLVSDLVTAGSPLASARLLLNLDKHTSFDDLVEDRIFPTCPPQTETRRITPKADLDADPVWIRKQFTFTHAYEDPPKIKKRKRSVLVPHHAGLFGLIRWTNLYFPTHGLIGGDPIGGELHPVFGSWIRDVELRHPGGGFLGFAHSFYWQHRGDWAHVCRLKKALELPFYRSLDDLIPHIAKPEDLWWVVKRREFREPFPNPNARIEAPGLSPKK